MTSLLLVSAPAKAVTEENRCWLSQLVPRVAVAETVESDGPEFKFWLYHVSAAWLLAKNLIPLNLNLCVSTMRKTIPHSQRVGLRKCIWQWLKLITKNRFEKSVCSSPW